MSSNVNESFAKLLHSPDGAEKAIQKSIQDAHSAHGKAGKSVPIWRYEKVVWVKLDHEGNIIGDA